MLQYKLTRNFVKATQLLHHPDRVLAGVPYQATLINDIINLTLSKLIMTFIKTNNDFYQN